MFSVVLQILIVKISEDLTEIYLEIAASLSAASYIAFREGLKLKTGVIGNGCDCRLFFLNGAPTAPKTAKALPEIIKELKSKGFEFVKVNELLGLPGASILS